VKKYERVLYIYNREIENGFGEKEKKNNGEKILIIKKQILTKEKKKERKGQMKTN
jgi:hypothetical protein